MKPSHTGVRLLLALVAVGLVAGAPRVAEAQGDPKKESLDHYNKGKTHYDLGRFDEAIKEFEAAYQLDQNPVFLFNIAQSYRQKGDAKRAIFFYRRFLSADPENPKAESVQKRIKELEELVRKEQEVKEKPPDSTEKPTDGENKPPGGNGHGDVAVKTDGNGEGDGGGDGDGSDVETGEDGEGDVTISTMHERPRPWRFLAEGGVAIVNLGDGPEVPVQASIAVGGAYSIPVGPVGLDVGFIATFTPIPYSIPGTAESGNGSLVGALANGAVRYPVTPKIDLRGELGLGAMWWSGLDEGNPFTDDAMGTSGPLPMFSLRAGVGVDVMVGGGFMLSATLPAISYSPANTGLDDTISGVMRVDLLVGFGYAL